MKCSNCDTAALWVYHAESIAPTPFCDAHLPGFLRPAARAGTLPKASGYADVEAEVAQALAPEPTEEPAEEPRRRRPRKADEPAPEPTEPTEPTEAAAEPAEETVEA